MRCATFSIPLSIGTFRGHEFNLSSRQLQDERHTYEKCQYVEFKKRVAKMEELKAAKEAAKSQE